MIDIARRSEENKDELYVTLGECKKLGRLIKSYRMPVLTSTSLGDSFVSHGISDHLLEIYLSTFELTHRVLHIPSFRREYARFRDNPGSVSQSFKMQLQLCLAIGASMRDSHFTLRDMAVRWVYEARLWLILPSDKDRISVTGVQVMCLLQIARQAVGVAPGVAWPDVGALLRSAMFAGMHRDPRRLPTMTVLRAEVRRRLWATILELAVQTCLDAGAPPLVSLDDFDTEPPLDLDDDQLTDDPEPPERAPAPTPAGRHTQTSLQLLLLAHFPLRLAVARFVNEFRSSNSYDEALRLHEQIAASCRATSRRLSELVSETASSAGARITVFHQRFVELATRRFILALHYPFLSRLDDPAFYFSRKVISDAARRIGSLYTLPGDAVHGPEGAEYLANLSICSTGFSRTVMQVFILIGPELVAIKREEMGSYGEAGDGGTDLRALMDSGLVWAEARIRAGETNVKGAMFLAGMIGQADGVVAGLGPEEMETFILGRTVECVKRTYGLLQEVARDRGIAVDGGGGVAMSVDTPVMLADGFGPSDPFDALSWQLDWEDMSKMSNFLF